MNIKFESNDKKIEVGKNKPFRLLGIEGIDSGEYEISKNSNLLGDGSKVNNKNIVSRNILLEIEYTGSKKTRERSNLSSFFNVHHSGIMTFENEDIKRQVEYEVEGFKSKLNNLYEPLRCLINLYCPNPFWLDTYTIKEEVAIWRPSFEFPLELVEEGIEMGYREPSLIVNLENEGDVSCGMKIQFKALATVVSPSLFNINTREYLKINKTMEAGEVLTVTTHFQNKRVELNKNGVASNVFNWIDLNSTFLQLDVGDNLLRYDAEEGLENLEVNIYYTQQYLGV